MQWLTKRAFPHLSDHRRHFKRSVVTLILQETSICGITSNSVTGLGVVVCGWVRRVVCDDVDGDVAPGISRVVERNSGDLMTAKLGKYLTPENNQIIITNLIAFQYMFTLADRGGGGTGCHPPHKGRGPMIVFMPQMLNVLNCFSFAPLEYGQNMLKISNLLFNRQFFQ